MAVVSKEAYGECRVKRLSLRNRWQAEGLLADLGIGDRIAKKTDGPGVPGPARCHPEIPD
jgi:hypothetical protein